MADNYWGTLLAGLTAWMCWFLIRVLRIILITKRNLKAKGRWPKPYGNQLKYWLIGYWTILTHVPKIVWIAYLEGKL